MADKLRTLQLEQLIGTLKCAESARGNMIETKLLECQNNGTSLSYKLRNRDKDYHGKLMLALFTAQLYTDPGHRQPHRLTRVLELITDCTRVGEALKKHLGRPTNWGPKFAEAVAQIGVSVQLLEASVGAFRLTADDRSFHVAPVGTDGQALVPTGSHAGWEKGQLIPKDQYHQQKSPYEREKASSWVPRLLEDKGKAMAIESLKAPLQLLQIESNQDWSVYVPHRIRDHIDYASVNALWHSLTESNFFQQDDHKAYIKLCGYVVAAWMNDDGTCGSHRSTFTYSPVVLAFALLDMHINLGFIFGDDLSVVIWPLGKPTKLQDRQVLLYCAAPFITRYGDFEFVYRPVNISPQAPTSTGLTAGAQEPDSLRSCDPESPESKHLSFLGLPAELRNQIFNKYLDDYNDESENVSRQART